MGKEKSPYVISSDVHGLLEHWAPSRNLKLPENGVLTSTSEELRQTLHSYFNGSVEVINEEITKSGLTELAAQSSLPIISLDRAYVDENTPHVIGYIDATRAVDESFQDIGLKGRPGYALLEDQIDQFRTDTVQPVVLLDDVIFGGGGVIELADRLKQANRPVEAVFAGIGIKKGVDLIKESGINVVSVFEYDDVVDEVCERDFRAGIPMSGRSVFASDGEIYSAPYFKPFGDAAKWASIPKEHEKDFSAVCLDHSITIWEQMEQASDRKILTDEVPRKVKGLRKGVFWKFEIA